MGAMTAEINELTALACEGSGMPLTTTPLEGTPRRTYPRLLEPTVDPTAWPVLGPTKVTGPPMSPLPGPPAWWADAVITD